MRQDPILDGHSLRKFYARHYRDLYTGAEFESLDAEFNFRYENQAPRVFDYVRTTLSDGGRVLDLGCGGGWFVKYFADKGFDAEGVDYDERYTAFGRSKGLQVRQGGIEDVPPQNIYNMIILNHVYEHVPDLNGLVQRVQTLLADTGYVYISVPGLLDIGPNGRYAGTLLGTLQNAHIWNFTLRTLQWTVERNSPLRLVRGDEVIDAIFARGDSSPVGQGGLSGEYKRIVSQIKRAENIRYYRVKRALDRIGVLGPLKSVVDRLRASRLVPRS